jgi:hypothetical protein
MKHKKRKENPTLCGKCGMRQRQGEYWHTREHKFDQNKGKIMVKAYLCPTCAKLKPLPFICNEHQKLSIYSDKFYIEVI